MSDGTEDFPLLNTIIAETYRVTGKLGAGGMGSIYEVEHVRMGRKFALKLLDMAFAENDEVFKRFKREAEIAGQLGHPNIVEVTDFNRTDEGTPYIVMEKLNGEDLADRIARAGAFAPQAAFTILLEVIDALEAAHAAGVVHRDLKPQNIFLHKHGRRNDYVKLLDFGISKMKQSDSIMTRDNAVMGTPYYMSPEQAEGRNQEIDARTDIFAMGAIIYEMFTGKLAFYAPSVPTAMFKVCYEEPEPIETLVPNLVPGLSDVLKKALQKDKNERYASARAMGDDIERVFQGQQATFETGTAHQVLYPDQEGTGQVAPTTLTGSASQVMDESPVARRSNVIPIAVGVVGILAIVGAAIFVVMSLNKGKDKADKPATAAATNTNQEAEDMKPLSKEVVFTFLVTPKEATVQLNGKEQTIGKGKIKRTVKWLRGEEPIKLKVTAKGYAEQETQLIPDEDQKIKINLRKQGAFAPVGAPPEKIQVTRSTRRRRRRRSSTSVAEPPSMRKVIRATMRRVMARPMVSRMGGAGADSI